MNVSFDKDLRGRVKGKNLKRFVEWFDSKKDREISCSREFREELILSGILNKDSFEDINPNYIGTNKSGIFKSDRYGKEFLLADIYELQMNKEQKDAFTTLKQRYDNLNDNSESPYTFVSSEEIKNLATAKRKNGNYNYDISNHTKKILMGEYK